MTGLPPRERWRRAAISVFIAWNAAVVLLTNTQYVFPPMPVLQALLPYARATRVMQRWALFCPEPRRYMTRYAFDLTFRDGSRSRWSRPASPDWGFFARHHAANWQKYDTASNHMEDRRFQADLAAWVASQMSTEANPVTRLELRNLSAPVPPPESGAAFRLHAPEELAFTERTLFRYDATTRELKP